ncbi:related to multidrug resistance-associated protein [Rhynchosporium secalis]|uniref:Related to multidrug resistance-associated protein n=1 Tax=Rhynchosporium secalis TaxID=38038 RepID=A0A1E1MP37_RHYSE|nr:related to multidrug resistance-associated protein [Rhynchosporium secalis]
MDIRRGLARPLNSTAYDNSFGPFLNIPGKRTFDFTLLFEETILSIGPSTLLLLLVPPRILQLWKSPHKTKDYQTLLTVFAILQIINVVKISQTSFRTRASLASALLALAASLGLCVLSNIEHTKNIRPSSIINSYLLLTLPFDAAQVRTRWLRSDNLAGNGITSAILAVKLLVLVSEAIEKKGLLFAPYVSPSPETTSGLYSRGFFWWLNPLFQLGFSKVVNDSDLFSADEDLLSKSLKSKFSKHWTNRSKYPQKHTLVWVMLRTMVKPLLASVPYRLAWIFFRFMQPLFIRRIIELVGEPDSRSADNRGWGLTAAVGLVFFGLALNAGAYHHKANRMATMVRGSLVNAVYVQTLDLSITSLDESAAVTLMSSDVERICAAIVPIHAMWSSPVEITLAIWFLSREIGIALLGPLFVTALAISGPFWLSGRMGKAQGTWMEKIQTRIDATAKMLSSMKGVKMLGLSDKMSSIISQLRLDEIKMSLKMRKLMVGMIAFGNMSDIFAPGAAFAIYVLVATVNGQTLDVKSAYTALSLIALLVAPIRDIVFSAPPLVAAVSCFDRIEKYLCSQTKKDYRMLLPDSAAEAKIISRPSPELEDVENSCYIDLTEVAPQRSSSSPAIEVKNLTLAWSAVTTDSSVIKDLSLEFQPGQLTMIVGPVGCGKSSLLQGLLGETPSSKGNVYINHAHISFVGQAPWIQNDTVRNNIIGVTAFDPEWYAKVVQACALDRDIGTLSESDNTRVGSGGAALSGGQRLRVALARAVYSRKRVLILDDVFSGIDATSEDCIFSRLLGKTGLLRQISTTVILVTHAAHRLSYSDNIISLNSLGALSEQGTFQQLISGDGYVASLAARHTTESEGGLAEVPALLKAPADDTACQNAAADLNRPVGNWSVYKYYFASAGLRNVLILAGFTVTNAAFEKFPDLWIKIWTSAVAVRGNSANGIYLGVLLGVEVLAMVAIMSLAMVLFVLIIPKSATFFHSQMLETVQNAPLSFFTSTDVGQVVNRFSQDLAVIDSELPLAALILTNNLVTAIIQAILICVSTAYFAAAIPFIVLVVYVIQKFYLRTSRQLRLMDLEAKAPLYSNFLETLSGLVTIRAFGWEKNMEQRSMLLLDASQRPFYLLYCVQRWLALVVDLMVAVLAVILVAIIVRFRHRMEQGFAGVALVNIMSFSMILSVVVQFWTAIETSVGAVSRIQTFVNSTQNENILGECQEIPSGWPYEGNIVLADISAAYSQDLDPALSNISISITAGQRLGICGASGSGKSSFVALLFHMLNIQHGSIKIDGIDITKISRQKLRESLSVIPQDPVFLKGTIRQGLDPLDLANECAAETALRKVGLWAIVSEAGGLDAPMEPEDLLSHGQRQLFCLARAMLRSSKILVVDEATASVDLQTDELMQRIISEEFKEYTIIAVAHRLQTIRHYDRIAVFGNGKLVEYGEPDVLLADGGSRFKALWDS